MVNLVNLVQHLSFLLTGFVMHLIILVQYNKAS